MSKNIITIQMQNHSQMAVLCEPSVRQELSDYFCFDVPGAKFMPVVRRGQWDGKIRLFNMLTCELHVGLYAKLCRFCADRHYHMALKKSAYGLPNAKNTVDHQVMVKELASYKSTFEPRPYQYEAIVHAIERKRAVLLSQLVRVSRSLSTTLCDGSLRNTKARC